MLGDSTAVGLGDPAPGGGWRGVGALLAAALGDVPYANLSLTGARVGCVRREQLPRALELRPDVVVVIAGMNDTLRSDFDPQRLRADLDAVAGALRAVGTEVLVTAFHDHGDVFRLPGPLRRALHRRIAALNEVVDEVSVRRGARCLDLRGMPGVYEPASWSVDRLHPSERGHRMLARGYGGLLVAAGLPVPHPVGLDSASGRQLTVAHHCGWLALKGVPWLCRRGRDLLPHAAALVARDLLTRTVPVAGAYRANRGPGRSVRERA